MLSMRVTSIAAIWLCGADAAFLAPPGVPTGSGRARHAAMAVDEKSADFGLNLGQKYGPTSPAHPAEK